MTQPGLASAPAFHHHGRQALLVGLAALAIVAALLPDVLLHPGRYLFGDQGDAIKNYFTLAYYVQYDHGQVSSVMNYPRGEHVNFLDQQPLLAIPLAWAREAGLPVTGQTGIAATNLLLLLGLAAAAAILYLILRRLLLPGWYATLAALLLTFLAPQILRFQGHMSLGYACVFPLQWYLLLRGLAAPRRGRWWLALGVFNLAVSLLTAYYLAMFSLWLLAYVLVLGWQRGWRQQARLLTELTATAVLPMLAFRTWLLLTDHLTDRPPNPWGVMENHASFASVFAPVEGPLKAVWQSLFNTTEPIFEGTVYVGVVGLLVLLASAVLAGRYAWRRQWQRIGRPVLPAGLGTSLWAAALLLLLAMVFPFRLPGFGNLVGLLGPLKQFRALGRFAWPFYYVFGAYSAFYLFRLWRYLRQHRVGGFAAGWLLPLLLLWGAEAVWHTGPVAAAIRGRESAAMLVGEQGNYREILGWDIDPTHYQAILPLPYFMLGTDKLDIPGTAEIIRETYRASYSLHLPLLTLAAGRSSVSESMRMAQLLSSPLVEKPLLSHLPSDKPILLVVTPQPLTMAEQRVVALGRKVASTPAATFYELPVAALAATTLAAERHKADSLMRVQTPHNGLYTNTGKGAIYVDFAHQPDRRGRLAPGAFYEPKDQFSTLYNGPLPMPADTGRYEVSVWVNEQMPYGVGNLQVKVYGQNDQQLNHVVADTRISTENQGDWVCVVALVRVPPGAKRLEVLYQNRELLADDLLIRPQYTDVYWRGPNGQPVLNTYPLTH